MKNEIIVLFIGDIVGRLGRKIVKELLPKLKKEHSVDLTIANGENSAAGYGITEKVYKELTEAGIDVITMGNHMFDKKDFSKVLEDCPKIIRPANYPPDVPGKDNIIVETKSGKVAVINLLGRVFMPPMDCPFRVGEALIEKLKQETPIVIVDFHAEATSEKCALGYFLDGKASAIIGTHTHVMTADERILAGGTAYLSDLGMTGAYDSVIGMNKEAIITRFLTQMPHRFEPVTEGTGILNAVILKIDPKTGKAKEITRINKIVSDLPQ
jgi:metallophosphoesterase (TIGR00282 family)